MHVELLQILREPRTGAPLKLVDAKGVGDELDSGVLVADTGGRYPILRGIPRFVPADNYSESFGEQWNKFREVQLDSKTGRGRSERVWDYETGWTSADLSGKWVLDAGCGAGRFAEIAARRGANLVAMDMSSSVEATAKTLAECRGRTGRVDVVQGSLLEPPFAPGSFDFGYSVRVLQHTPDPEGGIRQVVGCVRKGGFFTFVIYGRKPWTKLNAKYLIRPVTRRVPARLLLGAIERSMPVLFPVTDVLFRVPVAGKLARFFIPVANYVDNHEFTRDQRYAEAVLDTFDMLSPRYDSPVTAREVERALRAAGAQTWDFRSRVPVIVRGQR